MASTQPRKNKAGWLSLGWLTDPDLVKEIKELQAKMSIAAKAPVPLSRVVRALLKEGLKWR